MTGRSQHTKKFLFVK